MTIRIQAIPSIPSETARKTKAIFGNGNFYINVGDHLSDIIEGIQLECLSESGEELKMGSVILSLVTFFQYIEDLTDVQAADAVRARIEWKYALHLPINTLSFHPIALCEHRRKILGNLRCQKEYQKLIYGLMAYNPPLNGSFKIFRVLDLVVAICSLNRQDWALTAVRESLEVLAGKYPEWLRQIALPHWYGRYNRLSPLRASTSSLCNQELSMEAIGADIHYLVMEISQSGYQDMRELAEVKYLYTIWNKEFGKSNQPWPNKQTGLTLKDCFFCFNNAG